MEIDNLDPIDIQKLLKPLIGQKSLLKIRHGKLAHTTGEAQTTLERTKKTFDEIDQSISDQMTTPNAMKTPLP